jgi:hypothetical protein
MSSETQSRRHSQQLVMLSVYERRVLREQQPHAQNRGTPPLALRQKLLLDYFARSTSAQGSWRG